MAAQDIQPWYDQHVPRCGAQHHTGLLQRLADYVASIKDGRVTRKFFHDPVLFTGRGLLQLFDAAGQLKQAVCSPNLVVDTGRAQAIDRLQTASPAVCDYQAVGTNNTAAAAGDTTLNTEIGTRVQGTLSQPTAYTDRLVSTFSAGNGTGALVETGRLNASSAGVLMSRIVFSVINKGASDSLQTTHDITD